VLGGFQDSPEALPPLPVSERREVEIEKARLRFGIPYDTTIDEHGHRKKASYEQVDLFDPHAGDEMDQENEEILWWLGASLTYNPTGQKVTR
jgi:hypothetical protein